LHASETQIERTISPRVMSARPQARAIRAGMAPRDVADWLARADVVMLNDVLEHVPDDQALLASIVGACPAGCQVLLTVPADMRLWSPHDEAFGHYRRYDAATLAAVWELLPVHVRMLSYFNARLYPAVRAVREINRRRGRSGGEANTDFRLPPRPTNRLLTGVFAGEGRRLKRVLHRQARGYRRGVSLIAVLQVEQAAPRDEPLHAGECGVAVS
jgi:hypothetical protein